jgi:hypothetical protein
MIGTDQIAHASAGAIRETGAPMAAHIKKCAQGSIQLPHQKQRHAGIVVGEVVALLGRALPQLMEDDEGNGGAMQLVYRTAEAKLTYPQDQSYRSDTEISCALA